MSESKNIGQCRKQFEESYADNLNCAPRYAWITADAIDRLAADVAAIKAKVDDIAPEDVAHLLESEKAWVRLVEEKETAAIRERDEALAEVERLRGELAARPADGNRQATLDSSTAAPQQAAPPVVEVPVLHSNFYARNEAECYREALDKAGVEWSEVPRG